MKFSSVHCSELVAYHDRTTRHDTGGGGATRRRYLFPHSQIGSLVQLSSYIHIYSRDTLKLESWHNLVFIYRCNGWCVLPDMVVSFKWQLCFYYWWLVGWRWRSFMESDKEKRDSATFLILNSVVVVVVGNYPLCLIVFTHSLPASR